MRSNKRKKNNKRKKRILSQKALISGNIVNSHSDINSLIAGMPLIPDDIRFDFAIMFDVTNRGVAVTESEQLEIYNLLSVSGNFDEKFSKDLSNVELYFAMTDILERSEMDKIKANYGELKSQNLDDVFTELANLKLSVESLKSLFMVLDTSQLMIPRILLNLGNPIFNPNPLSINRVMGRSVYLNILKINRYLSISDFITSTKKFNHINPQDLRKEELITKDMREFLDLILG